MPNFLSSLFQSGGAKRVRSQRQLSAEKRAVWEGKIKKTKSGLTKSSLMVNARGVVVSKAKSALGKKQAREHLFPAIGGKPKKGTFKLVTRKSRKSRKSLKSRK